MGDLRNHKAVADQMCKRIATKNIHRKRFWRNVEERVDRSPADWENRLCCTVECEVVVGINAFHEVNIMNVVVEIAHISHVPEESTSS